ncbi:hypothetical protein NMY22_g17673 [Coprinellus aureogranulatus]|nr:hypothetical protein NMY22_g17673 [Coprinellus aureogranulatus]
MRANADPTFELEYSHEGLMLPYEEALTRELPMPPALQPSEDGAEGGGVSGVATPLRTFLSSSIFVPFIRPSVLPSLFSPPSP